MNSFKARKLRGNKKMQTLVNFFIFSVLPVISAPLIYANDPYSDEMGKLNYREETNSYNQSVYDHQYHPDASEERHFMMQSRKRFDQIDQENHKMMQQD